MSQPEISKEELIEFIGLLRQKDFGVSTEQYVSAHHLICVLAAQPGWPDPRRLGQMLSPLLCSTREEQESFPRLYEQWLSTRPSLFRRGVKAKSAPPPVPSPVVKPKPWRLRLRWWGWATVLGLATMLAFTTYKFRDIFRTGAGVAAPTPTPVNGGNASAIDWVWVNGIVGWIGLALGSLTILFFVVIRLLRYTRQLGLKKLRARGNQRVDKIKVKGASEQLLRTLPLRRVAQEMRRYRPFDETDLDVPKTVEETIRAGIFTPAFTSRKALPEYLVLIDRATPADQQARLADSIVNHLVRNDVPVERYFFQEDPRICHKEDLRAQFQTLQELALQHPRHYLLIFSDGAGFFNPLTGRPHRWLETFASWPMRLLLTSEVQAGGYRDWVLSELGFRVLPAGRAGLTAISESLDGGLPRRGAGTLRGAPLPPLLRERPGHGLKSHPPRPELVVELCRQLKDFLGNDGYYWLSACAVYPLLYLDLTFYLGERLTPHGDLFETYSKLVRLPWFRSGSMPDWLRAHLIIALDETRERAIRTALEDLLIGSLEHPDGFVLPIVPAPKPDVQDESGFLRRSWLKLKGEVRALRRKQLAEDILRSQPDDNRLRDYVAVTFMAGHKPNKLAVKVPRELYPVLYPPGTPVVDRVLGWMIIVIAILTSSMLLIPAFASTLPIIAGALLLCAVFVGLNVMAARELARGSRVMDGLRAVGEAGEPSAESVVVSSADSATAQTEATVVTSPAQEQTASGEVVETEGSVNETDARPASKSSGIIPIFVSSVWLGLAPERKAVEQAVQRMRETKFGGIGYFGVRDETTQMASLDEVDWSLVYIGIFGARYGSGVNEAEYRRARSRGLPCFIYFKNDATVTADELENDADKAARLAALKEELRREHTVKTFDTPDALSTLVLSDLHRWLFDQYLTPKLEGALSGETSRAEAQALLGAVKDLGALSPDLLNRLQSMGIPVGGDFMAGDKTVNVFDTTAPAFSPQHQLRAPVGDFVGREKEIDELLKALRGGGSAAISGISGMGGIGKTELALLVADRLRPDYPDAQLFVDMSGTDDKPRDPADALAACVRALVGLDAKLPESLEDLTKLYREVLYGKRALILLDNAFDSAQVRPLLPPPGVALLVTSRNVISLPRMTVTLEQLAPAEARELLTSIAPRVPPDIADRICFLCGYLPLAIRAAGSLLDVTADLDPADYAAQLRDERARLELISTKGADVSVEVPFNLSYARLSPDAARVFRQLAVFPATFDAEVEEVICEDKKHKHLNELVRRNLVLYDPDTARYRFHNLARIFADSRLSESERSAGRERHASYYLGILREAEKLYVKGGSSITQALALFDSEWNNIEAGQAWAENQLRNNSLAAELCSKYPLAAEYLLDLRQHPRERIRWLEVALQAARQMNDRAAEGSHLGNLGASYLHLGESSPAAAFFEQQLAIAREIGNRQGEAQALGNLGFTYSSAEDPRRAIEFHEQSLTLAREIMDRRGEATALGSLGLNYFALGETRRAIEYYEQSIIMARDVGDRRSEGWALGNLGSAFAALGETRLAIDFYERCIAIAREIGDLRVEGIVLSNLGLAFDNLGDRTQAIAHAEAALKLLEQIESPQAIKVREQLSEWRDLG